MPALPPLNIPEEKILNLHTKNPNSRTVRALSAALRLSIQGIDPSNPLNSIGPDYLASRFKQKLDLNTLNQYQVILSKKEGCKALESLGVLGIGDKYLNRHIDNGTYASIFKRHVSKCRGRGNGKLVFTYGEIIYFFAEVVGRNIPNPLPDFPESLSEYADDGEQMFPEIIQ